MNNIKKLVTKKELLNKDQARNLEEQLLLFPDDQLPKEAKRVILNTLYQIKERDKPNGWIFTMISREQIGIISKKIRKLEPKMRPVQTRDVFMQILINMRQDTGEIMQTRQEIAEEINVHPNDVSFVMRNLENMGVVRKEYHKIEGVRGRGMVVYFVNPGVAWNGSLETREQETERTKEHFQHKLKLIEGGMSAV